MFLNSRIKLFSCLGAALMAVAVATLLPSCGGGGGDGGDPAFQPAPQTLHALAIELTPGGIQYVFVRDTGNTLLGELETGGVVVRRDAPAFAAVDEFGIPATLTPSNQTSTVTYTYERVSPEYGIITITGDGSGVDSEGKEANYYSIDGFVRRYEVLFATDGSNITNINVDDYAVSDGNDIDLFWRDATIKTYAGGDVPVGYSIQRSNFEELPTLYPESIDGETITINPDGGGDDSLINVLSSTYTRFINDTNFQEEGVATLKTPPSATTSEVVNYIYESVAGTINLATLTIIHEDDSREVYNLKFLDQESGNYTEGGSTGLFEIPFLLD